MAHKFRIDNLSKKVKRLLSQEHWNLINQFNNLFEELTNKLYLLNDKINNDERAHVPTMTILLHSPNGACMYRNGEILLILHGYRFEKKVFTEWYEVVAMVVLLESNQEIFTYDALSKCLSELEYLYQTVETEFSLVRKCDLNRRCGTAYPLEKALVLKM